MCISASVGPKGKAINHRRDVKMVQVLLNLNLHRLTPLAPLAMDGGMGKNTLFAIDEFQRRHVPALKTPDSKVDPGGNTLKELKNGIPAGMTFDKMQGIMIDATESRVTLFYQPLVNGMNRAQINTPLRMMFFIAVFVKNK